MEMVDHVLYLTAQIDNDISERHDVAEAVKKALQRFNNCDYGKIGEEDTASNNRDLENETGHVLGRYGTPNGDIYINLIFDETGRGRHAATIMYCSDY